MRGGPRPSDYITKAQFDLLYEQHTHLKNRVYNLEGETRSLQREIDDLKAERVNRAALISPSPKRLRQRATDQEARAAVAAAASASASAAVPEKGVLVKGVAVKAPSKGAAAKVVALKAAAPAKTVLKAAPKSTKSALNDWESADLTSADWNPTPTYAAGSGSSSSKAVANSTMAGNPHDWIPEETWDWANGNSKSQVADLFGDGDWWPNKDNYEAEVPVCEEAAKEQRVRVVYPVNDQGDGNPNFNIGLSSEAYEQCFKNDHTTRWWCMAHPRPGPRGDAGWRDSRSRGAWVLKKDRSGETTFGKGQGDKDAFKRRCKTCAGEDRDADPEFET
jgi:hypothetical protein